MADICNRISKNISSRSCATAGGTARNSWTFQADQFTGAFTKSGTTGAISGFTLKPDELGIKGIGRPKKGSGSSKGTQADTGSTEVEQTLIQEYKFGNQLELDALEEFFKGEAKVTFQELANGAIRIFFKEFGNESGTAEEGTGVLLPDESQVMKVTLVGKEPSFPVFFEAPISGQLSQLASSRAYLDALVQPD
ncbi:hypothetical protein [Hymenobacter negativus]|uniref:Uncharacterized protein n=1 Tax=Hymenobacter negativus TaxID=2795026 RepID=A0ABS3QIJ5_9BACT|nr:hypothetical protein [Hymenobacter negativus]MBO2010848.1 hypothetical protein [Hymenobacter negativus]